MVLAARRVRQKYRTLPDFIGIGAQKAGTTWLYQNLRTHPDVWLPSEKELHYFDEKVGSRRNLWNKLFGDRREDLRWRSQAVQQRRILRRSFSFPSLRWAFRYLMLTPDDDWYLSLFAPGRGKVTGEITPNYALLDEERVAHVRRLAPDARIFFFMRHPVERAWSHALMQVLGKGHSPEEHELPALRQHFDSEGSVVRNDYLRTISIWSSQFTPEQVFLGYLEDIHFHPHELLRTVCDFLGVEDLDEWPQLKQRVFSSGLKTMPLHEAIQLARIHTELAEELAERFGGYADFWKFSTRRILELEASGAETLIYPFYEGPLWEEWVSEPPPLQSGTLAELSPA